MNTNHARRLVILAVCVANSCFAGDVVFDGTLPGTSVGSLAPTDSTFVIEQQRGFVNAGNLFHSFQDFNVDMGETAVFESSDTIHHILARVTGNMPTAINGTLRATNDTITGFWLLNPAGLLVGEDAVLDIPGAVALGATDVIQFSDGGSWAAVPDQGDSASTLSADPDRFGFVDGSVARGVSIRGQHLEAVGTDRIADGRAWIVSGSEVSMESADDLTLVDGVIATQSHAAASGDIELISDGDVHMSGTLLLSNDTATRGGDIRVRARDVLVADRSAIISESATAAGGGSILVTANNLYVDTAGLLLSESLGPGRGGDIKVTVAGKVRVDGAGSGIASISEVEGGDAGNIDVDAAQIEIVDRAGIISLSFGSGRAGDLDFKASDSLFMSAGFIDSEGDAGGFEEFTGVPGDAGSVDITIGRGGALTAVNDSEISSGSVQGEGGDLTINLDAGTLEVDASVIRTTIRRGTGSAGDIRVNANGSSISLVGSGVVTTVVESGNGGSITIERSGPFLVQNSEIGAQSGAGDGGNITINSALGGVFVQDSLSLVTAEAALGVDGQVTIDSPNTDLNAAMQPQYVDISRPAALASNACAPTREKVRSTLVQEGKGGSTRRADDYLMSAGSEPDQPRERRRPMKRGAQHILTTSYTNDGHLADKCF